MLVEWSTQRARRVRACAVLAMHVHHPDIHTLWRFPCASIYSSFLSKRSKKKVLGRACLAVALI